MDGLSQIEIDAVSEIISIGAGHASNALSVMTGKHIKMEFPEVKLCPIEKIPSMIGSPQELVVAVYMKVEGRFKSKILPVGSLMLLLPHESAVELSALLEGKPVDKDKIQLSEMDVSALEETGNILSGASLTAISKVLDIELVESLPNFAHDMLQAVLSFSLMELAPKATDALSFNTNLEVEDHPIRAYFLILLDPESLKLLRAKLSVLMKNMLTQYIEEEYTDA